MPCSPHVLCWLLLCISDASQLHLLSKFWHHVPLSSRSGWRPILRGIYWLLPRPVLCVSAWPPPSPSLVLLFRYLSCLHNFPHGALSNTLLWETRSISFLLSRKSMILSKQDTGFFFWHNLCLVKLWSILDHFCSYFFGYHFFQTMSWAFHPADQLSSLNAVAPALHCCPHGLKPLLWGSPSSYPFMYLDRKKLHFFY